MAKKVLFSMLAGMFVMAMAGLAAADRSTPAPEAYRGMNHSEMPAAQPTADPETQYLGAGSWVERGPVETGSMPMVQEGAQELRCCDSPVDAAGSTKIRPGIDDGP